MEDIDVTTVKYLEELISYIKDGKVSVNYVEVHNNEHFRNDYNLSVSYMMHDNKKEDKKVKILVSKESPNEQQLVQRLHPFNVEFLDYSKCDMGVVRWELLNFEDEIVMIYGSFSHTEIQFLLDKNCTVLDVSNIFV